MKNVFLIVFILLAFASCKKDDDGMYEDFYGYWEVDSAAFRTDENRVVIVTAPVYFFNFGEDKTVTFFNFYGTSPDTSVYSVTNAHLIMNISDDMVKDSLYYEFSGEVLKLWKMEKYLINGTYQELFQQKYFLKPGVEP